MYDIFTYPNNESTYYVDPNYIGDDTVGFQGRVKDMIDEAIGGNYDWIGTAPQYSLADTLLRIGRYYNFYNNLSVSNLSIYDMTQQTLAEFELSEKAVPLLNIKHSPTEPLQFGTTDPSGKWGLRDGRDFYWHPEYLATRDITNVSAFQKEYFDIGQYTLTATADSTDTVIAFEANKNTYWQTHDGLYGINPSFLKYGPNGSVVKTVNSMGGMPTISRGFKKQDFTEAHDTGTLNGTDIIYFKDEFGASFTRTCYMDAACTIPASLDENYIVPTTAVFTITAAAGTTTDFDFSNESLEGVLSLAELQTLEGWSDSDTAYGRMYYQNLTGTDASIVTKVNSNQDISDSLANSYYDNTHNIFSGTPGTDFSFEGESQRNGPPMDGQLVAGATQAASVEIHVKFINAARMQTDDAFWTVYDGTETIAGQMVRTNHYDTVNDIPYWGIDSELSKIYIPGNRNYRYKDTNGDFQFGAQFSNDMYLPGEQFAQAFDTWGNIVNAPNIEPSIDGFGRSDGNINFNGAGNFRYGSKFILRVESLPDEYVPPAPTPEQIAAAEDNFDTNDNWDDFNGFSGGQKKWPLIPPKSARIDFKTPTLTTTSQSGIKYARHAGFTRYGLDVTYPPLKREEMAEMQAYSELARGGAVTFIFDIDPLNTGQFTGFGFLRRNNGSTNFPRIKEVDLTNNTYLLEGFDSNTSNAFIEGQLINSPSGGRNGSIFLALNTTDANIYGEARMKFGFNDNSYNNSPIGNGIWLNPDVITVSLSDDNFQYVERGDGLYDCSVRFDLDFWK